MHVTPKIYYSYCDVTITQQIFVFYPAFSAGKEFYPVSSQWFVCGLLIRLWFYAQVYTQDIHTYAYTVHAHTFMHNYICVCTHIIIYVHACTPYSYTNFNFGVSFVYLHILCVNKLVDKCHTQSIISWVTYHFTRSFKIYLTVLTRHGISARIMFQAFIEIQMFNYTSI